MLNNVKAMLDRTADTAVEDAVGAICLFTLLFAGLCLPGLV